jgi:ribosomal-protein-alanine N-acetyltransferase
MTPDALAALHRLCFTDAPRPWSAEEFRGLLALASTLFSARPGGFAVGRLAGPEAELLTLAVHPASRRRGLGAALVGDIEAQAAARGAEEARLEVAVTNAAGRALYAAMGYAPVGRRPGYYARARRPPVDALVLLKRLEPLPSPPALQESI